MFIRVLEFANKWYNSGAVQLVGWDYDKEVGDYHQHPTTIGINKNALRISTSNQDDVYLESSQSTRLDQFGVAPLKRDRIWPNSTTLFLGRSHFSNFESFRSLLGGLHSKNIQKPMGKHHMVLGSPEGVPSSPAADLVASAWGTWRTSTAACHGRLRGVLLGADLKGWFWGEKLGKIGYQESSIFPMEEKWILELIYFPWLSKSNTIP